VRLTNVQRDCNNFLQEKLTEDGYRKVMQLDNAKLNQFVADAIELCQPESVFVCTDSPDERNYIRTQALALGEEKALAIPGHTVHFDGVHDQGRDKENTKYLLLKGVDLGAHLNAVDRESGLEEVKNYLQGAMAGRQMLVCFLCLGPCNSEFSISSVQLTDSFYVAHSQDILYRPGYEQFKLLRGSGDFFRVLHSMGRTNGGVSIDVKKRRIYIDLDDELVFSVNTQYAGNTVGLKKLSLRLAIRKADREGWLAEHMFVMGAAGPGGRVTYFAGAFPSFCGKTSTSMLKGESIIGDDLAYLRKRDGRVYAVNVERGIFGIVHSVNTEDDPVIWETLTTPGEVIFSNVLVSDGAPYWEGSGRTCPENGVNFAGPWHPGKKDENGKGIPLAHKNARYTVRLDGLANLDTRASVPEGVPLGGIIYGGRDSDTWVPVQQSFDWVHGVFTMAASLESETTAATLGREGVRTFQPMSNLDFVSIPLGGYLQNHLDFVTGLDAPPKIFAVNYFLKNKAGRYLNGMNDKKIWVKWMELRANDGVDAVSTPAGLMPLYDDLRRLFQDVLGVDYSQTQYVEQFMLRVPENLRKLDRIEDVYRTQVPDTPDILFEVLAEQRKRLAQARDKHGDYISPLELLLEAEER